MRTIEPAHGRAILPKRTANPQERQTKGVLICPREFDELRASMKKPCWIITTEYNIDEWPNAGIAMLPKDKRNYAYGALPLGLLGTMLVDFLKYYDPALAVKR